MLILPYNPDRPVAIKINLNKAETDVYTDKWLHEAWTLLHLSCVQPSYFVKCDPCPFTLISTH